jgi:hypothetical protein
MSRAQLTSTVEQNSAGAAAPIVAGKNFVANGGFDIWQRGTSISLAASASNIYTADRWVTASGANQAMTVARYPTSDTTNLPNIQYCARVQRNSGQTGTSNIGFLQTFETVNSIPYAGKTVTFSFYARAGLNYSATSNGLTAFVISGTGTDQSIFSGITNQVNNGITTFNLTTTWARYTLTTTIPSNATQLLPYFQWTPTSTALTNDYYEITGIQLEIGSVATPFSRAGGTLQGELALCQRYYQRLAASSIYPYAFFTQGTVNSSTQVKCLYTANVAMRSAPSFAKNGNWVIGPGGQTVSSIQTDMYTSNNGSFPQWNILVNVASGLTVGQSAFIYANNDSTAYLEFSAEL